MGKTPTVLLLTLSGTDAPGITSEITQILALHQTQILDIAQAVIQNLLSLSILFELAPEKPQAEKEKLILALQEKSAVLNLKLNLEELDKKSVQGSYRSKQLTQHLNHYAVT